MFTFLKLIKVENDLHLLYLLYLRINYLITTQAGAPCGFDVSNRYQKAKSVSRGLSSYASSIILIDLTNCLKQQYVEFLTF